MATPRDFSSYPPEYAELFLKASHEGVSITLGSPEEALRLRGRLYAFRSALYSSPQKSPEAALLAPLLQFAIKENTLIVSSLEPVAQNIEEALKNESDPEVSRGNRQHDARDSKSLHGEIPK